MKFGGTSVGDGKRIKSAAELVYAQRQHAIVVATSAMSGVTDALIRSARSAADGDAKTFLANERALLEQHYAAIDAAVADVKARAELREQVQRILGDFGDLCASIRVLGELTPRALDAIASMGERLVVPILAQALRELGAKAEAIEASELVVTDDNFTRADPMMPETREKSRARLMPLLDAHTIPVVTGFIGATRKGIITTLGRGGSDYTATILASAIDADEVWIWTDVDGVMTADPRIVSNARSIAEMSYAEAAELSYFGAKVIHPKTISPAAEREIPIRILNTFNPSHAGTRIVRNPRVDDVTVKAITVIRNLSVITIEGRGMQGVPGVAARVFSAVAREEVNVLMISQSSSEQNICFVVESLSAQLAIDALDNAFELERLRHNVDRVWSEDKVAIVAIVGAGMRRTPGISAKVFGALAEHELNVISIAQGSSEYNLSLVVSEADADNAVRAIHEKFL